MHITPIERIGKEERKHIQFTTFYNLSNLTKYFQKLTSLT